MIIYYILNTKLDIANRLLELTNYNVPNWYNEKEKELVNKIIYTNSKEI